MNINHINDLIFSVSYLKHNIEKLNNLQKQHNNKMLVDLEYKETIGFKIREKRIQQCMELHDLYAKFFNLGDKYKLENLLKEFEDSEKY